MTRPALILSLIFVLFCLFVAVKERKPVTLPPRWEITIYDGYAVHVFTDTGDSAQITKDYSQLHPVWVEITRQ